MLCKDTQGSLDKIVRRDMTKRNFSPQRGDFSSNVTARLMRSFKSRGLKTTCKCGCSKRKGRITAEFAMRFDGLKQRSLKILG